ncbi:hypothetical protein DV515_00002421 [Chloebia gouldiae]|uniref:MOB kinase activator 2 n=1 Tax=Chloebia gouldiae TaxID=44316 RepID=A0A3L8SW19_CHLGU|nr:hypothetical protein DV515_00002421 [Chloebia gouldiae]
MKLRPERSVRDLWQEEIGMETALKSLVSFLSAALEKSPVHSNLKSKGKPNGKKPAPEEKKLYLEPEYTKSRITDFEFKELVMLPREIDLNEWLASNTTTFFHHINLQYSTISEFCTGESCQTMAVCNTRWNDNCQRVKGHARDFETKLEEKVINLCWTQILSKGDSMSLSKK